jgi:hypothetical protein
MERADANEMALVELTDAAVDQVVGGSKVRSTATVVPGTIESGAETDPNIGTHTQLWLVTTVVK